MVGLSLLPIKYSLTLEAVTQSRNDVFQVFYDMGNGINEADSKLITMPVVEMNVQDTAIILNNSTTPSQKNQRYKNRPGNGAQGLVF